jgi:ribosomal protein S25
MLNKARINKNAAEALKKKKELESYNAIQDMKLHELDSRISQMATILDEETVDEIVSEIPKAKRGKNVKS